MDTQEAATLRQGIYWRLLAAASEMDTPGLDGLSQEAAKSVGMPPIVTDPKIGIDTLLQRHPALRARFDAALQLGGPAEQPSDRVSRALVVAKLLLNSFGPNTLGDNVSSQQFSDWRKDAAAMQRMLGQMGPQGGAGAQSGSAGSQGGDAAQEAAGQQARQEVGQALAGQRSTHGAGQRLQQGDAEGAATDLRDLAGRPGTLGPSDCQGLADALDQAAGRMEPGQGASATASGGSTQPATGGADGLALAMVAQRVRAAAGGLRQPGGAPSAIETLAGAVDTIGGLLAGGVSTSGSDGDATAPPRHGSTSAGRGAGVGFMVDNDQIAEALRSLEQDMIARMKIREVLADNKLALELTPSVGLVDLLLREKDHLDGVQLQNAKRLIRAYIDQVADVLRLIAKQTVSPKIDRSVPPKKVMQNLDVWKTVWDNLPTYQPELGVIIPTRLHFRHTARKKEPTRMVIVVDQSGSMVDTLIQVAIIAGIFAGVPNVDARLLAFDTRVMDLTAWVQDPFEVIIRSTLGGGTDIRGALEVADGYIDDPKKTALVLVSDFYEGGSDDALLNTMVDMKTRGVHMLPVGPLATSGYIHLNERFAGRLKEKGMPVLSGHPRKLITELRNRIP